MESSSAALTAQEPPLDVCDAWEGAPPYERGKPVEDPTVQTGDAAVFASGNTSLIQRGDRDAFLIVVTGERPRHSTAWRTWTELRGVASWRASVIGNDDQDGGHCGQEWFWAEDTTDEPLDWEADDDMGALWDWVSTAPLRRAATPSTLVNVDPVTN